MVKEESNRKDKKFKEFLISKVRSEEISDRLKKEGTC